MSGIRDNPAKVELNKGTSVCEALISGELPPDADVAAGAAEDYREVRGRGGAVQLYPSKPMLKPPGTKRFDTKNVMNHFQTLLSKSTYAATTRRRTTTSDCGCLPTPPRTSPSPSSSAASR